jgi:small subunit ribosomal protein S16
MLAIRFLRSGRRNAPFFRIVLTESSKPPKSGFIKVLGWYNPKTKDSSLKREEILDWLNKGAKPSNSLSKLLEQNKISHKLVKFVPAKPKAKKAKNEAAQDKVDSQKTQATEEESAPAEDQNQVQTKPQSSESESETESKDEKKQEEDTDISAEGNEENKEDNKKVEN